MPRILDNISERLDQALVNSLAQAYRLDTSVGYFNLRGWRHLADSIDDLAAHEGEPKVRLLIGMNPRPHDELRELMQIGRTDQPMDLKTAESLRQRAVENLREQLTFGFPSTSDETTLRQLRRQLVDGDVVVKLFLRHPLHAKLYLCHRDDHDNPRTGFVGSSNLTFSGIAGNGELNVDVLEHDATEKLHKWFKDRWEDQLSIDVTQDLIEILDESWAQETLIDPYLIYLKMAYHLSREAREGLLEWGLPEAMKRDLLDFQTAAVQIAARILQRRGGVLVGDVVGLGKTMVATAIARLLQEEAGTESLIICPKNLVPMWEGYVHRYRLHAHVLSQSMVLKQLPDMRRYRVVIVDESHNYRSHTSKGHQAVRDYIERNDSKVILLTATPYNKRYLDVANQLALFLNADTQLGIQPDVAMRKDPGFLGKVDGKPGTLGGFRKSEEPEDWRRIMSLFLIRRTRGFIRENYAETDDDGRQFLTFGDGGRFYFPDRVPKPLSHTLADDDPARLMVSDDTLDTIDSLRLPRYALGGYLIDDASVQKGEQEVLDDLQKASGNLSGVTRISLYKRLSSSGAAFTISLQRHLLRNWVFLNALRDGNPLPIGHVDDTLWDDDAGPDHDEIAGDDILGTDLTRDQWSDVARSAYAVLERKESKAIRWIGAHHFQPELIDDLEHDIEVITALLATFGEWEQTEDSKLDALETLLRTTHKNEKVLVFSEYKDTAEYVANALATRGIEAITHVSGSSEDPMTLARRFAPGSNAEVGGLPDGQDELRVLVSTDVLSEGQNLQDAHIVVNYDLPWAIIKIIQRAGRVDRIGQQSPEVLVYSFLPADDVEGVIGLRRRIATRLKENAVVFGSDEAFFGDDGERKLIEDLYNEGGNLNDLDDADEDVDWASMAYAIWTKAIETNPDLEHVIESMPDSLYATRPTRRKNEKEGVIVHAQAQTGFDVLAFTSTDGASDLLLPNEALLLAQCKPESPAMTPLSDHHELVRQAATGPLRSPATHLEGALTGVRKQCWNRLTTYKDKYEGSLFDTPGLDRALDELYRKPLTETATHTLAKALRERTPDELAELIVLLAEEHRLCVADSEMNDTDLRLMCSLGIRAS